MMKNMTYEECVDYILSIPLFAGKLGTENLSVILDLMGHPEQSCKSIHVAGTNGKGSTCLFLASILQQYGKRVGVFTSPHLISINERIRINDDVISEQSFLECFFEVMNYVELAKKQGIAHPSFFEFIFLMACVYFRNQEVDFVIFETGMGGRMDATNVVTPLVSIITSIGMDHMQYLGETKEQIAAEKAGIIKKNVPVVFFDRKDEATAVVHDFCVKNGSNLHIVEKTCYNLLKITDKTIDFCFQSGYYIYSGLKINKTGLYQVENAILALKAFELLYIMTDGLGDSLEQLQPMKRLECCDVHMNYQLTDIDRIQDGLRSMRWPCRMECIANNIYVDGAHNEEAIEAFCNTLETMFQEEHKLLLFAVSKDKDYESMIARLCNISFEEIIVVRYEDSRAAELDVVKDAFRRFSGSKITVFENIREGFLYGKSHVENQVMFCVGSLYLAGNLLSLGV